MTSSEKILDAEDQVREVVAGQREWIDCPFCGLHTARGQNMLCCEKLSTIVAAVLDHIDHLARVEAIERMWDRYEKMRTKAVLN